LKILERDIVKLKIQDLKLDPDNPNKMTQQQLAGLEESMVRFGYLTPIVVDQDNKIADGEHRVEIYKAMGLTEIPAYKVKFKDDVERRLLRQAMNKLRGEHDFQMDRKEIAFLSDSGLLTDLSKLIAQDQDSLKLLALVNKKDDEILDEEAGQNIDEFETNNKCPKCGFAW
jgi:ParB-like chromosome segregation protein Spo0J